MRSSRATPEPPTSACSSPPQPERRGHRGLARCDEDAHRWLGLEQPTGSTLTPDPRLPHHPGMDRRRFLLTSLAGALAAPLAAEAQKSEKMARVGILGIGPAPSPQELAKSVSTNPFWLSMRQLGWVDGQNMVVERRFGESADQLRTGAADLVRLKVDVLFVGSAGLAKILQLETKTIPIVVGRAEVDLVAAGLVDSLARPGGNITGSQLLNDDLIPKRLELLKALVPNLSKVAFLREDVTLSAAPPDARSVRSTGRYRGSEPRHRGSYVHRAPSGGLRCRVPRHEEESRPGCIGGVVAVYVRA